MRGVMMKGLITALLAAVFFTNLFSQDLHFSQYNASPLYLNPALTGVNEGDYRFIANYRNQWTGLAPYRTFGASFDIALGKKTTYSNYSGLGVMFFSDKAGDSEFTTNHFSISAAYTLMLDPKGGHYLTGAIQGGIVQRSIDVTKLTFDSQFGANGYDPTLPALENIPNDKMVFGDIGAGFLWSIHPTAFSNYYAGLAVTHLNQPNQSFFDDANEKLFMKISMHGGAHFPLSNQFFMLPNFLFLKQGPATEYNLGMLVKIKKSAIPSEKTAFYAGGAYRIKDAIIFQTRIDFGGFNIGASYDLNISGLTPATRGNGGPELSLIYTGSFRNKNLTRFCPML